MPATRWIRPLLLALLVVFAGCSMPAGTGPTDSATTPGSGPAGSATTADSDPGEGTTTTTDRPSGTPQADLPPGVTDAGLENASALLAGHRTSLRATGYRLTKFGAGSQMSFVAESNFSSYRVVPGPTSSNPAVWANETATFAKLTRDGETEYQRPPRLWAGPGRMTGAETLRLLLEDGEFTTDGTRACADRRCTVLNASGSPQLENFTARALVHESGVVHQFHASYSPSGPDANGTVEYHLVLDRLGDVTVSRPPWVETAVEET